MVRATNVVVQQRREIVPVAAHRSRHSLQCHRERAVCRGEITLDVQRQPQQRVAPPLRRSAGARYGDGRCVATLNEITDALPDDPIVTGDCV